MSSCLGLVNRFGKSVRFYGLLIARRAAPSREGYSEIILRLAEIEAARPARKRGGRSSG
jgi:hypothetical protein